MTEIFRAEGPDLAWLSACYQKTEDPLAMEAAQMREAYLRADQELDLYLFYRNGQILGFVQGFCADHPLSLIKGEGLYTAGCIFAPSKTRGTGKALMLHLETKAREKGARGMALIAFNENPHMPVDFFKKLGYSVLKRHGNAHIMVKSFDGSSVEADFVVPTLPDLTENTLHIFYNPLCFGSVKNALAARDFAAAHSIAYHMHDAAKEGGAVLEGLYFGKLRLRENYQAVLSSETIENK